MAQRADDIRHDIADTRAAMTVKLALLEERVLGTVAGTQASVEKIMEDVGGIVQDVGGIVKDVKATVDTTLVAMNQGVTGAQASVEKIVQDVGGIVQDVKVTVDHDPRRDEAGRRRCASLSGRDGGAYEGNDRGDRHHGAAHL